MSLFLLYILYPCVLLKFKKKSQWAVILSGQTEIAELDSAEFYMWLQVSCPGEQDWRTLPSSMWSQRSESGLDVTFVPVLCELSFLPHDDL